MRPVVVTSRFIRHILPRRKPQVLLPQYPLASSSSFPYYCRLFSTEPENGQQKEDRNQGNNSADDTRKEQQDKEQLMKQIEEDIALNKSYTYWQRIKNVYKFTQECGSEEVLSERMQAYEEGGVIQRCSHLLHSLFWKFPEFYVYHICGEAFNTLSLCHNPLLHKYDFDPFEFMRGTKHAYVTLTRAMLSENTHDYLMGKIDTCEEYTLLQQTHTPFALMAVEQAMKNFIDKWGGHYDIESQGAVDKILDARLCGLNIYIVDEENGVVNSEHFPLGSVVINAHVRYTLEPPPGYTMSSVLKPEIIWSYQSCISGHKETCWKVVAKDRELDNKAALYRARSEKDRQSMQDAFKN